MREAIERLYRIFSWPENSETFRHRVEEGVELFDRLLAHEWLAHIKGRGKVRVLDAMGGTGVGGVSLALALKRYGVESGVTVLDVRGSALELARRLSMELIGAEISTIEASLEDLLEVVSCPFDIIINNNIWPQRSASRSLSVREGCCKHGVLSCR